MEKKFKAYLQDEFQFSSLDAGRIIYAIKAIFSELSKLLIALLVALPLGYADEVLIATIVLLSIRCNSGGLHFSHYISCFLFTSAFYVMAIALSRYPLSNGYLALGLLLSLGIFLITGPITSVMRPRLTAAEVKKFSHRVIILLLVYSSLLILLETLPYRELIYWVIVLQIFQLLCAKIARKGEIYEKTVYTKNV